MIVKTGAALRGTRTYGLVHYLMGPGRENEHLDPRVIAGYRAVADLNPKARTDGRPGLDIRDLVAELDRPVARYGDRNPDGIPAKHVFHTIISNRPDDPLLTDEQWADIAYDTMRELGLAGTEQGKGDIRWVAVRHDPQHVHLAGTLIRADESIAYTRNDFKAAAVVRARMEAKYGLARTNTGDRTASIRPTRAESEKATRHGRSESERETVRRLVRAAAGTARSAEEFRSELISSGVLFTPRRSTQDPKKVTGYKAALRPERVMATVGDTPPVWFAGGGLDKDLTWPKLCARWARDVRPGLDPAHEAAAETVRQAEAARRAAAAQARLADTERRAAHAAGVTARTAAMAAAEGHARELAEVLVREPELVDSVAAAVVDAATVTADLWQEDPDGRTPLTTPVMAADFAQRAGRTPGGAAPVHGPQAGSLRTAVRAMHRAGQLSADTDLAGWITLAAQIAAMLDAVAAARAAQARADQAEAARDAAAGFRVHADRARTDPRAAGAPPLVLDVLNLARVTAQLDAIRAATQRSIEQTAALRAAAQAAAAQQTAAQQTAAQRAASTNDRPTPPPPTPGRTR